MEKLHEKDIVVIGAGLTGLTAGFYLNKAKSDFLILEKARHAGGVIRSSKESGFLIEHGPNTGVLGSEEAVELFDDLNGDCEFEVAHKEAKKRYIFKGGKWHAIPSGLLSAISTPLFTLKDKFRILGEPFRKKGTNPHETLAELVKRRMGKSFLEYAVDPFVSGVYSGDVNYLVPKYALPKLYNLEQQYGSFVRGAIQKKKENKGLPPSKATREVFSVKKGLQALTDALVSNVGESNLMLGCDQLKVTPKDGYFLVSFRNDGIEYQIKANKVITATGGYTLSELLPFLKAEQKASFESQPYAKVISINLGFHSWVGFNPDGFGGLIPSKEHKTMLGVLFMSTLFKNRAPEGAELFTVFMGGYRRPDVFDYSDEKIIEVLKDEFTAIMEVDEFKPDLLKIHRYKYAIPQYGADMDERLAHVETLEKEYPGLLIGGNLKDGIGMADRIKQGKMLAQRAVSG